MQTKKSEFKRNVKKKIVEKKYRKIVGNCGEFYYLCTQELI